MIKLAQRPSQVIGTDCSASNGSRRNKAEYGIGRRHAIRGFTLIELMITLMIAAIVVSVGVYNYGNFIMTANRTEARAALAETAGALEKCKALYGAYNNANCSVSMPYTTDTDLYSISGVVAQTTYVLTATPAADRRQADDQKCQTFTLNQAGARAATGNDVDKCW